MKKVVPVLVLFFLITLQIFPQVYHYDRYEAILGVGATMIFGDIGDLSIGPAVSFSGRYLIQKNITLKGNVYLGLGFGSDKGSKNDARGYEFRSFLLEVSIQGEYFFYRSRETGYDRKGLRLEVPKFSSYAFVGLGGTYFKPTLVDDFDEDFVDDFRNFALVIPAGVGFQYGIGRKLMVGIEAGGRYTRTDYLDGYTSENSTSPDIYYFATLNAAYRFQSFSFKRGFN